LAFPSQLENLQLSIQWQSLRGSASNGYSGATADSTVMGNPQMGSIISLWADYFTFNPFKHNIFVNNIFTARVLGGAVG
jgi:hypothetical protein